MTGDKASRHGLGPDANPERLVSIVRPGVEAESVQGVNLGVLVDHLGLASDYHTPPGAASGVVVVSLEDDVGLAFCCRQLRPGGGPEGHALPVDHVIDRQDDDFAVGLEADPSYRD